MAHSKKFRKLRDKKFMMTILIGLIATTIVMIGIQGLFHFSNLNLYSNTDTVNSVLLDQRFIRVKHADAEFNYGYDEDNFDLQKK